KSRENLNCVHRNGYDMPTGVSLHASQGVGSSGEAWINAAIRIQPVKREAAIHYFLLVVPSGDELTIILGKQGGRYELESETFLGRRWTSRRQFFFGLSSL